MHKDPFVHRGYFTVGGGKCDGYAGMNGNQGRLAHGSSFFVHNTVDLLNRQNRLTGCLLSNRKGDFENSHPDPTGLRAKRTWLPSAASCAFVAACLEIPLFGPFQYLLQRPTAPPGLTYVGFMIAGAVIGIAAQARALWGVGRRQQAVALVSARLGQWAVATYYLHRA